MKIRRKTTESIAIPDVGRRLAVLSDGSSVSIVGAEGAVRIRFEADGRSGRLVSNGGSGDVVVAEGATGEIVDMFADLRARALPRRRPLARNLAFGTAVLLLGGFLAFGFVDPPSPPAFDQASLANAMKSLRIDPAASMREARARSVALPEIMPSLDAPASKPSVALPSENAKAPNSAVSEQGAPAILPPVGALPVPPSPTAAPSPAPAPTGAIAKEADKADPKPKPEERGNDQVSIAAVISRMNAAEAQKAVAAIESMKKSLAETGEIPPEVWREIPHEIATALKKSGVPLTAGERREAGRKVAAVVRLPASFIEDFRGKDGIASIPDSNSWVLTDGNVLLPLPGGGDIRTADAMKEFGLQP